MQLAAGLVIADRFRLVRPLGQGGMGAVWLAQHTSLDVPCAVKFIHEQAAESAELRTRFEREAKAAAQLRSPHVVQILDHGVWQGMPYMAMEYLEGEDLGERLQRCGRLTSRDTLAVAAQIGRALTKAHAAGLVHRDLKPSNVFIVRDDEREVAKVLDFGVAKVKETGVDGSTRTGAILGTPFYMSPEQARGSKGIDHRSDLWALAVVVYQCVTGRLPFVGEALGDLFVKIIVEPLPVPSQGGPVPPGFDAWWARAAARDPGQRFQTAKELTDALGVALGVTVPEGTDMAISAGSGGLTAPLPFAAQTPGLGASLVQSQGGGTVAMDSQSGAHAPSYPGLRTPSSGGQATPYPGAIPPSGVAAATSQVTSGPIVLTPAPGAGAHAAPPPKRGGVLVAVVLGGLAIAGAAAFFVLRGGAQPPVVPAAAGTVAAPTPPTPTTPPAPLPTTPTPQAPAPTVQPAPTPAAESAAAAPTPSAPPARGGPHTPAAAAKPAAPAAPAAPAPGKPKTDFGF